MKKNTLAKLPGLYATEAYLFQTRKLIPLNAIASELMEAKTEKDIEAIFSSHGIHLPKYSPYGTFYRHGSGSCDYDKLRSTAIWKPSYASWLLVRMKTFTAYLEIYAVCLPIARGSSSNPDTVDLFNVLYYTHKAHQQMIAEAEYNYGWIRNQSIRQAHTNRLLKEIPKFPLTELFDVFQSEDGYHLQQLYGYTFKQMRRRGDSSPPRSQYHYWDNPTSNKEARARLWGYASNHRTKEDEYILNWDPQGLASLYLRILDRYIETQFSFVRIRLDSVSGRAGLVGNQMHNALNLWLFTQVQSQTDYRICKMCGRLFIAGSQKGKKYCDLHEKYEINYYNKTIGQIERTSISVES